MSAVPIHHLTPNAAARAVKGAIIALMRVHAPRIVGPADSNDILARGEMLEEIALIFDPSYAESLIATAMVPIISMHDEAADRMSASEDDEDDGSVGRGSVAFYADGGADV